MSRAKRWRERRDEADAARVTLPEATPLAYSLSGRLPKPWAAEAGGGSIHE